MKRGVVIMGTPRSGTTLLRRILDAHPALACPPETYLLSAAARFLHEESFAQGLKIGVLFGLGYAGFDEAQVLARLRTFVFEFFQDHARQQGKNRWVEKTAFDGFHLAEIRRICQGHVDFVCIQRHGLDVACSLADLVEKTGGYVEELHTYLQRDPEPLAALARAWVDTASAVADLAAEDERTIDIRYEALTEDPQGVIRQVLEFIDEPWEEGLIERALRSSGQMGFGDWKTYARTAIDTSSVDRWKQLPPSTVDQLARICNPTLDRLGYTPVPTGPADEDAEAAKRRYELGLMVQRMRAKRDAANDDDNNV